MTNDPLDNSLCELGWRRKLTAAEEAELRVWLTAHPEALADWESEAHLTEALGLLPNVPVASNFTARVLQAVEREAAAEARRGRAKWMARLWRLGWLPRIAAVAFFLGTGLLSYRHFQRVEMVRSMEVVARAAPLPSPQVLEDFDAIRAMGSAPAPDEELLALLQ